MGGGGGGCRKQEAKQTLTKVTIRTQPGSTGRLAVGECQAGIECKDHVIGGDFGIPNVSTWELGPLWGEGRGQALLS